MGPSLIYRNSFLYETLMLVLYGREYRERYRTIAELIPRSSSVLDLCCGPATLFHRHLKQKDVRYTGIDINPHFIERLRARGAAGILRNLDGNTSLPRAEYVLMQASLYHFLPDSSPVVELMCAAAEKQVLIAEPVRNMADSNFPPFALLARKFTNPGTRDQPSRFNEALLDSLFEPYRKRGQVIHCALIAGGREKLYVLNPTPASESVPAGANGISTEIRNSV
jgi:SAM-dependent methyltransferase